MRFTMIIPVHNGRYRIETLLDSIMTQQFTDYDVIVVCDKCTDGTADFVRKYFKNTFMDEMNRYDIIECDHGNAGLSRNEGLKVATGEYILFADDDDYILHKYVFQEIDKLIKANDNPDIIHFGFIFGTLGYVHPMWNDGHLYGNVWSKAYKRTAIADTRFPNVYPDDDLQFNMLMEKKPLRHLLSDSPIYYYNYMREGSISWKEKQKS